MIASARARGGAPDPHEDSATPSPVAAKRRFFDGPARASSKSVSSAWRPLRPHVATAAALVGLSIAAPARAEDPWAEVMASPSSSAEPPLSRSPAPQQTVDEDSGEHSGYRPRKTLLLAGAGVFFAGYSPIAVAALPALGGVAGRGVLDVLTLGLHEYYSCHWYEDGEPDFGIPSRSGTNGTYFCGAAHGGIQLLVPFAGPFLFAANHPHDDALNPHGAPLGDGAKALLYTSGAAQVAGGLLVVAGFATARRPEVSALVKESRGARLEWAPIVSPGSFGVGARVVGW